MFQAFLVRSLARRVSLVASTPKALPITARSIFTQHALLYPAAKATTPSKSKTSNSTTKGRTKVVKAASSTKAKAAPKKKAPAKKTTVKKTLAKPKKDAAAHPALKKKPLGKPKATTRARKPVVAKKRAVKEYTPPPKRPMPAFFRWCMESQTNGPIAPGDTLAARTLRYAEEWKSLPDSVKQTYHDKLVKDTRDWHTAHEAWQSSLSRKGLSQYRKDLRLRARRRALRDVETGEIIKKLPNAFNIYFQETFPELKKSHPEETHKEIFARTSKSWTTLAESEKAVFIAKAADLRPAYLEAREKAKKKKAEIAVARNPILSTS